MGLQGTKADMLALSILAGLVWASMAPLYLFFGVYLRSLGLTYGAIGLITTTGAVLSSFPQIVFGAIADRINSRKRIISFAMLIRTASSLMSLLSKDLLGLSVGYVAMSFSLSGFMPIAQSMVADISGGERLGRSMGRYRLFGSAGWAISCVLTGCLARWSLTNIFPITFAASAMAFMVSLMLPDVSRRGEGGSPSTGAREGRKMTPFLTVAFLLSIMLSCLSMGAATSFLTISLAQLGIEPFFLGIVIATGGLFEVPSMYVSGLLCDRIGSFAVLSIGEVGLAAVYWLYGTVTNITTYVLVQGLRGILYAVFTVSGMAASSGLGGRRRGSLYAGLYNLSYYLGSVPGPYMGGLISDYMGLSAMFTLSSAISIASAALLIPFGLVPANRHKPK